MTKVCNKCKIEKPQTSIEFGFNKTRKDGLHDWCRLCAKNQQKEYREKNREKIRLKNRKPKLPNGMDRRKARWLESTPEPLIKKCISCKLDKTVKEFRLRGKKKNSNNRYKSSCKSCEAVTVAEYWKNNPEKRIAASNASWLRKKAKRQIIKDNKPKPKEGHKFCSKCKVEKMATSEYFYTVKKYKNGLQSRCKECHLFATTGRKTNKFKWSTKEGHKFCRRCDQELSFDNFRLHKRKNKTPIHETWCLPCEAEDKRIKIQENPEKYKEISKKCRTKHKERTNKRNNVKFNDRYKSDPEWREKHLNKGKRFRKTDKYKEYREIRGKAYMRAYIKKKKKDDPVFKLSGILRSRTGQVLRQLKYKKSKKFKDYLGCTPDFLKSYLESLFQPGMTWDNHGFGNDKWHVDHITPYASAKTEEDVYKLSHYSNLQPMWQPDNLKKSAKMPLVATL